MFAVDQNIHVLGLHFWRNADQLHSEFVCLCGSIKDLDVAASVTATDDDDDDDDDTVIPNYSTQKLNNSCSRLAIMETANVSSAPFIIALLLFLALQSI